jgi:hypothetical protein
MVLGDMCRQKGSLVDARQDAFSTAPITIRSPTSSSARIEMRVKHEI